MAMANEFIKSCSYCTKEVLLTPDQVNAKVEREAENQNKKITIISG